jgi:hypothetical protein
MLSNSVLLNSRYDLHHWLLELVAFVAYNSGIGILILIAQMPLFGVVWVMLRTRYSPPPLQIISAKYGEHGQTKDVTKKLQPLIKNGKIEVLVSNKSLGFDKPEDDPYSGVPKHLDVIYTIQREKTTPENETLILPET